MTYDKKNPGDSKSLVFNFKSRQGAITLPVVLVITGLITALAVSGVLLSIAFGNVTLNTKLNAEAYQLASAGAEDGIIKVIRYCPIGAVTGSLCPSTYTLNIGTRTVTVLIRDDPSNAGSKLVISTVSILGRTKRIQVILSNDQTTGLTTVKSFRECYNYDSINNICLDS